MATREVQCINPQCGTLNRVPHYSFRRVPQCGKCHAKLPEGSAIIWARWLYDLRRILWLAIPAAAIALWISFPYGHLGEKQAAAVDQCAGRPQPREGVYRWYGPMWGQDVAEFTLKTASGSNYFVKLEDEFGRPVRAYFVRGGSTISNLVPLGTFTLKYASGQWWCGEQELFGVDTSTNEADDTFSFERNDAPDGYTLSQWTVELISRPGGNLRTHAIPRNRF